ncbi:hypothetical protein ACFT7S_28870 [Streptomyces sp. NPDC057136]|uniref:hypothetical protein n=1 Tax=Streptomyces sp. NPDC057136 TaxID=3346029 RepID=UPI003627A357
MTDARPVALVCALLDTVDSLSYPQRMRELAARARRFRADGVLRAVLEELENGGGPYERGLAVIAAAVGQDREWIERCLADEDSFVRSHALQVARSLGVPDTAYERALADAPTAVRRRLMRAIVADGRTGLADRLIDGVRETWGDAEAARLLPGCSTGTVSRLLPDLFRSVGGWTALGRRHPGPLLDAAEQDLAAQPEALRDDWWRWYGHDRAVAAAAPRLPHRVLDLLERHGPSTVPVGLHGSLGPLATADPARLLRLLVASGGLDALAVSRSGALGHTVLHRLARQAPEGLVVALARTLAGHGDVLNRLLLALPPARRAAFHEAVVEGRGESDTVDAPLLDAMPRSHVAHLARRMADRARDRGEHWSSVLLAESYLPPAEVRERLLTATRRPAAADRAEAWPLLIRNAGRSGDPSVVATVLDDMLRLRNEQDPVRSAALRALLGTAPALFTDEVEPLLDRITTDAVEAPDSSPHTRSTLSSLALGILREHTATGQRALVNWALRTLVRLSGSTGHADLGRLDRTLRRGQEHTVFEALRPWLEAGSDKSDYGLVFALTRAVGRRAAAMPELQELLWQAVRYGNNSAARTAIGLWLQPAADRDERVERVLAREPSAAVLPDIIALLTGRRTDLLDPYLAESPPYGRFLTHGTSWTPPVEHSARWVPRQQLAAAHTLARAARDEKLPLYARAAAITDLARIPGHGVDAIREWTASTDVVLAEAALAALARTDAPADALPELLAHTGDDRARVAVYAASRAALHTRPATLGALLRDRTAPGTGKVTSRKEMVRLAATRLPVDQAAQVLAEAYATADQHPDVRAACVAFGTDLLGDERMWEVMTDAARGGRALRTAVLRAHPAQLPEAHRPRYARLVQEVCATDDEELAALAHHTLARWVPWAPGACDVFVAAVIGLDRRGAWQSAADALVGAALSTPEAALALNRTLLALAVNDTADEAGSERDRPARQRVVHTVRSLTARSTPRHYTARPVLAAAGTLLAAHRDFVPQAVELLVHAVDPDPESGPGALHTELARLAVLHEGRPVLASRTARTLGERISSGNRPASGDTDGLLTVAARLTESGGCAEGLFAAAITAAAGRRTAWTGPWRTQLRLLRQHPVADVRDAAYAQVTATE